MQARPAAGSRTPRHRPIPGPPALAGDPVAERRIREARQRRASRLALREVLIAHRRAAGELA